MHQVYETVREENLATMAIRRFENPEERWRIKLWGTRSPDGGAGLPLWDRLYERESYPDVPIIEGNVREAADKALAEGYKKWKPPLEGPRRCAPWLVLGPAPEEEDTESALSHRGLLILGEQDGVPAMFATRVSSRLQDGPPDAGYGVWGVEFRPGGNMVPEYLPLAEAADVAAARLEAEDDLVIAVQPLRMYNHTAHTGWIHARVGTELRSEPMCWRGILDAPGPDQAAAAAAAQLNEWAMGHPKAENVVGDVRIVYNSDGYQNRNGRYAVWADGSYEAYDKTDGLFIHRFAPLRRQQMARS